jgi:adenine-specific DNA methylase
MSQDPQQTSERTELPIERGFPIERVNEIAEKEGLAKRHYRPIYTMHKWWARRLGCVFRAISLYALLDDSEGVEVFNAGKNSSLDEYSGPSEGVQSLIDDVELDDPDSLWELYSKDVRIDDTKVLDPFMGGGTSLVEASRFGSEVTGTDLNPVAWFVTKKELEAGQTALDALDRGFEQVQTAVKDKLTEYYQTRCHNGDHHANVMYYFWVKELDCTSCGEAVPMFNDYRVAKGRYENGDRYNVFCPDCESVILVDDWQSECSCSECGNTFVPKEGTVSRGNYSCRNCGLKYSIIEAIEEQDGFEQRLYAVEYYCAKCDDDGLARSQVKRYKSADQYDLDLFQSASLEWEERDDLNEFVPEQEIPLGIMTDSSAFEGGVGGGHSILRQGYSKWTDMFNHRQLLGLSTLLQAISEIEDQNVREYLLLTFSETLNYNCGMIVYNPGKNLVANIFKTNSFDPPHKPVENNIWGTKYGTGSFTKMWKMVRDGVEYAKVPTERYVESGETKETEQFAQPIGEKATVHCQDLRKLEAESEFDAVLTDPPYYDNIIYSELSNYYYVWQRILLSEDYEVFESDSTPRAESIVANPAEDKGSEEFEDEIRQAFYTVRQALKEDGVLAFTYHHSDSESWGELLEALCDVGFVVTAAYPISADINKSSWKLTEGSAVNFDIIVVARPAQGRTPTSWNSLRRDIYRTAKDTRRRLEASGQSLSAGDIGVMEMGECFREYSKHHGKVQREGETMSAKEVVKEIYGIIQEASEIGVQKVFIDLLQTQNPSYDDVNKLCRGTNASPDDLKKARLYNQDDGLELGTWDNEKRQAYIQERTNGDGDDQLSNLDKLQFLRYHYEKGQAVQNYVEKWGVDDDLRELAGRLADVTGDDTYTRVLGDRDITSY